MITKYHLKNFKSLRDVSFNPKSLNLMLGLNSMGKSSVIQSLLALRQSYYKFKKFDKLIINPTAGLVNLGKSQDVFFQDALDNEKLVYDITFDNENYSLNYDYKPDSDCFYLASGKISYPNRKSLFNDNFHYLQADHVAPATSYKKVDLSLCNLNLLGNMGENSASYLVDPEKMDKVNVIEQLKYGKEPDSISNELNFWMGEITPGVRISANIISSDLVTVNYDFLTADKLYTKKYSPLNVGFGLSYVLPLVLTILISKPGDILLIENPESHLHPQGQAKLGELLAKAASAGIQIFCETHSDHIINGARLAVHDKKLSENDIKVFYFEKSGMETYVQTINIDETGELDNYPPGLLDEWGNILAKLF